MIEDTLFVTSGGRTVKGGGGISPDFDVEIDYNFPLTYECLRKGQFLGYVQKHKQNYTSLEEVKNDKNLLNDFQLFLISNELEVTTAGEKALGDTKERLYEIDSTNVKLNEAFAVIDDFIDNHEETLFEKEKDKLSEFLYEEFASVYGGEAGRFKEMLKYDKTVNEALDILNEQTAYDGVFVAENQ